MKEKLNKLIAKIKENRKLWSQIIIAFIVCLVFILFGILPLACVHHINAKNAKADNEYSLTEIVIDLTEEDAIETKNE